ncbi:MAG: hypothetical protein PUC32_07015 [Oscillospiraceae bacterium]|nr:hypothetical protein [Oscillospiraceae bacterium]
MKTFWDRNGKSFAQWVASKIVDHSAQRIGRWDRGKNSTKRKWSVLWKIRLAKQYFVLTKKYTTIWMKTLSDTGSVFLCKNSWEKTENASTE